MGRYRAKNHLRWPPELQAHADVLMDWAFANSSANLTTTALAAAIALVQANLKEGAKANLEEAPDGRTVEYGVRLAAVHPDGGDYLAAGPWTYGIHGMDEVWNYVSATAWQLYDGMDAVPLELQIGDLNARTNTARVAMSRRADGVAVIRVRFGWQKKREKRNLRRGMENEPVQIVYEPQQAQLNIWIGPKDQALAMDQAERAARHPLAYTE